MTNKRRRRRHRSSITSRYLRVNLGLVALVLVILWIAFVYAIQSYYYNSARQYLTTRVSSITSVLGRYASDSDINFSSEIRSTIENFSDKDKMELMAINADGVVTLTSSGFTAIAEEEMTDYIDAMADGEGYWLGTIDDEQLMAITVNISEMNGEYSAVRVIASMTQIQRVLRNYALTIAGVCVGILLLLLATGLYFLHSIVRPIAKINATTKKFAKGDFSVRIPTNSDDEIGDLCVSINQMADELSNTENMKNEFISSISHELRTPLTAIQGWSETMCVQTDPETVQRGMHVIQSETERLAEMVEELLDFSRMQSGKLSLQCADMDILAELGDAVLIYTEKAKRENIRIIYQEPEMLPFIYGDKNRIRQVFINVIDNSIKYSNPGCTITISAYQVGANVQIIVSDNGVGISKADLPRIKTKFYKANHTRRGSGIGLAVADEIVSMHGGRLEITSDLGVGTSVRITLPVENDLKREASGE